MECRMIKLQCQIRNNAGNNFRIGLPTKWVRQLGLSEECLNVCIGLDEIGQAIIIKKAD